MFSFSLSPWLVSLSTISIPRSNILRHLEKPQHLEGFSTQMVSPLSGLPGVILSPRSVGLCMRQPSKQISGLRGLAGTHWEDKVGPGNVSTEPARRYMFTIHGYNSGYDLDFDLGVVCCIETILCLSPQTGPRQFV